MERKTIDQLEPSATVRITAQQILDDIGGEVGEIRMYGGATAPAGWLICDGSALSRTNYARLFNVIGVRFGEGDGVNTYNIPDLIGRFAMGADNGENLLGNKKEAGLPNITGTLHSGRDTGGTGAFSGSFIGGGWGTGSAGIYSSTFEASRSSLIYGNSNSVQPPATCLNFIIKY